jgi:MHS family proline/betaine transporter-like MFS transporter
MSAPRDDRVLLVPSLAGAVGNLLEWYDFGLYGLFAPIFAQLFFPGQDRIASLIGAYSGFAIGFAARPLGAAVLGHLGDRVGRRAVMVASIVLMGFATTATALLPTYHAIGMGAPILLLFMRLLQGFSTGGEFTGSVAYLVETAPANRRGLAGSIANIGATAGLLLAAGAATATLMFADSAELLSWMWRIPFLFGGIIATVGYFLRHRLRDTGYAPRASARTSLPLRVAIAEAPGAMLCALVFTSGYGIVNYLTMVFLPTFAATFGGVAEKEALKANTAAQALALFVVPLAGWMTDWAVRRRTLLIIAFAAEFAIGWSGITLVLRGGIAGVWMAQLGFAFLLAFIMAAAPATLAELFRSEFRLSAYSVSFNLGIGIAGGTAPLIATALIAATGSGMAPAWYLMLGSAIAAGAAFMMVDRSGEPLR